VVTTSQATKIINTQEMTKARKITILDHLDIIPDKDTTSKILSVQQAMETTDHIVTVESHLLRKKKIWKDNTTTLKKDIQLTKSLKILVLLYMKNFH
jgi:hypothetical protein